MGSRWHDESGNKFRKGNPGGPGRRRAADEERYLSILRRTLTVEAWTAIVERAIEQAKRGDDRARNFLANYAIGRPTEYVALDATTQGQALGALLGSVRAALDEADGEANEAGD